MNRLTSVVLLLVLLSCKKPLETSSATVPAKNIFNTPYGNDRAQVLDLYLPGDRNSESTPLLILIHAGGWTAGDKNDLAVFVNSLQQRLPGYAIANINYRLATDSSNHFPTQETDVNAAIQFLYAQRNQHGYSNKFVLMGASAGGHLALLNAYKYKSPVEVRAVVSFFGPTDIKEMYLAQPLSSKKGLEVLLKGTPENNPSAYQASSPVSFVNERSCATMLLHGGADPVVSHTQADNLKIKLETAHVPVEYVFYPAEGHGWMGNTLNDSFDRVAAFLRKHVD